MVLPRRHGGRWAPAAAVLGVMLPSELQLSNFTLSWLGPGCVSLSLVSEALGVRLTAAPAHRRGRLPLAVEPLA
eukprot:3058417-Rhodomonas_salina.1